MVDGGIFTILNTVLQQFSESNISNEFQIIALVNNKDTFNYKNIECIEFPKSKKSWFYRIYYEYFYFKKLSKKIKPDIWLSLHDTSPNVIAKKRFVYLHHPNTLRKVGLKDWYFDYKVGIFSLLYDFLFKINIKQNHTVFVQQHWIKEIFEKRFKISNIKVAIPEFTEEITQEKIDLDQTKTHFFYPSFPKSFKNIEFIFEAINLLDASIIEKSEFHITGLQNNPDKYARSIYNKYKNFKNVKYLNLLDRNTILKYYNSIDCLIFPSKMETWGLPITEAKAYKKQMLLANLPYAKETCGNYENVSFFNLENPSELAKQITEIVNKSHQFQGNTYPYNTNDIIKNWKDFTTYIIES